MNLPRMPAHRDELGRMRAIGGEVWPNVIEGAIGRLELFAGKCRAGQAAAMNEAFEARSVETGKVRELAQVALLFRDSIFRDSENLSGREGVKVNPAAYRLQNFALPCGKPPR